MCVTHVWDIEATVFSFAFKKTLLKCVSVVPSMNFRDCRINYAWLCQCTAIHWWNVKYYIVKEKQWWSRRVFMSQFLSSENREVDFQSWLNLWLRCVQFACSVNNCWDWINMLFSGECNSTSSMISMQRHSFLTSILGFQICSYHSCKWTRRSVVYLSCIAHRFIVTSSLQRHSSTMGCYHSVPRWKLNSEDCAAPQCNDDHRFSKRNEMISWLCVWWTRTERDGSVFPHQFHQCVRRNVKHASTVRDCASWSSNFRRRTGLLAAGDVTQRTPPPSSLWSFPNLYEESSWWSQERSTRAASEDSNCCTRCCVGSMGHLNLQGRTVVTTCRGVDRCLDDQTSMPQKLLVDTGKQPHESQ